MAKAMRIATIPLMGMKEKNNMAMKENFLTTVVTQDPTAKKETLRTRKMDITMKEVMDNNLIVRTEEIEANATINKFGSS